MTPSIGGLRKWATVSLRIEGKRRRRTTLRFKVVCTRN
jgi:hypothetical protein